MYARTQNNRIEADVLAAVCKGRNHNFNAARRRAYLCAAFANYLGA